MKNNYVLIYILLSLLLLISSAFIFDGVVHNDSIHMMEHSSEKLNGRTVTVADGDTLVIKSFGADLSYDITRINAKAGSELTLRYENSSGMPHNIIVVKSESDINPVGIAALQAMESDYVPMHEEGRMLAWTNLARPGEIVEITFTIPPAGTYPYICTYPGHFTMMQGRIISTE